LLDVKLEFFKAWTVIFCYIGFSRLDHWTIHGNWRFLPRKTCKMLIETFKRFVPMQKTKFKYDIWFLIRYFVTWGLHNVCKIIKTVLKVRTLKATYIQGITIFILYKWIHHRQSFFLLLFVFLKTITWQIRYKISEGNV
jgi:hypothetical protein